MRITEVYLSDGKPCEVRRLNVFDLDGVGPEVPGPFRYTYALSNGQIVDDSYDPSLRSTPPRHPGIPASEIEEGSPEYWDLLEFETHKAAIAHEVRTRLPTTVDFVWAISAFVVERCVNPIDRDRLVTAEDFDAVYYAAVVPTVTRALLAQCFRDHFNATFKDIEVFDAMEVMAKGHSRVDVLREWEHRAMREYGYKTEEEWGDVPLAERVRKVAGIVLPDLISSLETHASIEEMKARGK